MDEVINSLSRMGIDQAASAITSLTQTFQPGRSAHGIRNDLERARQHLSRALDAVNDALSG
jgi:hypothetical protein